MAIPVTSPKLTPRMRPVLLLAAAVIVLGAGQYWLWGYVHDTAKSVHAVRTRREQFDEVQARFVQTKEQYDKSVPLLDQLSIVFPSSDATPRIVQQIEGVGARHGANVDISEITEAEPINERGNTRIIPLVISGRVRGPAPALLRFIDAVEHMQYQATFQSWKIEPAESDGGTPESPLRDLVFSVSFYLQEN